MTRVTGRRKTCRVALRVRCSCDVTAAPRWNPSPGSSSCTKLDVFFFFPPCEHVGGIVPDFPSVWVCLCTIGDEQPCLWDEGSHWAGRHKNAELDAQAEPTPPSTLSSFSRPIPPHTPSLLHTPQSTLHAPTTTTATRSRRKPRIYVWMTHRRACVRSRPAGNDRGRWFAACVPCAAPYMAALNDKRPGEK